MGIKFFFSWLKSEFPQHMKNFKKQSPPADVVIDTFMIDLNGVFHNSAAKIYKYGNYESKQLLQRVAANPLQPPTPRTCCQPTIRLEWAARAGNSIDMFICVCA